MLRSGQDSFAVVGAGIKLLESSPQPAVRCVIVPSAPGYTLISCCCLFLCIRWLKTSVRQDGGVVGFIERVRDRVRYLKSHCLPVVGNAAFTIGVKKITGVDWANSLLFKQGTMALAD